MLPGDEIRRRVAGDRREAGVAVLLGVGGVADGAVVLDAVPVVRAVEAEDAAPLRVDRRAGGILPKGIVVNQRAGGAGAAGSGRAAGGTAGSVVPPVAPPVPVAPDEPPWPVAPAWPAAPPLPLAPAWPPAPPLALPPLPPPAVPPVLELPPVPTPPPLAPPPVPPPPVPEEPPDGEPPVSPPPPPVPAPSPDWPPEPVLELELELEPLAHPRETSATSAIDRSDQTNRQLLSGDVRMVSSVQKGAAACDLLPLGSKIDLRSSRGRRAAADGPGGLSPASRASN